MSSKLIHSQKPFFSTMVVNAVLTLDQADLDESLIGIKKIPGGGMEDSLLVQGVAFKKTFSYAGFEQQPKAFKDPKICCLNVELELKAERDNAEVRIEQVSVRSCSLCVLNLAVSCLLTVVSTPPCRRYPSSSLRRTAFLPRFCPETPSTIASNHSRFTLKKEYQAVVDAEWSIIYSKLEAIAATGAKVVLSRLPIGDLATQYFADRDIFCAGRVAVDDLKRVVQAVGGAIQSTCSDIREEHLGRCERFEEKQIGGERFNLFEGCTKAKTCTLLLRGGAEQFISEVERSLHDAIMIVKRAIKNNHVVAGGGATEVRFRVLSRRGSELTLLPLSPSPSSSLSVSTSPFPTLAPHSIIFSPSTTPTRPQLPSLAASPLAPPPSLPPLSDGDLQVPPRHLTHHRGQATTHHLRLRQSP
jgi:hypothetical protein